MSWQRASVVSQSNNFLCDISSLPSDDALFFFSFFLFLSFDIFVSITAVFEEESKSLERNLKNMKNSFNFASTKLNQKISRTEEFEFSEQSLTETKTDDFCKKGLWTFIVKTLRLVAAIVLNLTIML